MPREDSMAAPLSYQPEHRNSISNLTYQVQYRSDLTTNLWTSLGGCIRSTNSTSCAYDPIIGGQPQRFYRVLQTNCVP
jgi:hypothetical protein